MSKKILLADDSITIQKVVELTFSDGDYEVIAVNNGAKAVAKLAEMRPDIILSDIIMPEKNGYEVCEFVKSHPEYRNIPVVLLTGTFEPFDPDRADKAGCDAVVTKPFESQSLIHKVEELIEQARSTAPTAQSPAMTEKPAAPPPTTPPPPPAAAAPPAPAASPWMDEPAAPAAPAGFSHSDDLFGASSQPSAASPDPFGASPPADSFSGATRAFPKMNFDEPPKQQLPDEPADAQPPAPGSSPWDEQPAAFSAETRTFPRMNFDEMQRPPQPPPPAPEPPADHDSPFGASPDAESFSGETRAFPKMSMEDMKAMAHPEPPKVAATDAAPSPWDEQPSLSGETRTFPKMSFEESQSTPPAASVAPSPWDEPPAPAASAGPMDETPMESKTPAWSPTAPAAPAASPSASTTSSPGGEGVDLTDEQVDRIARRVVQMISDQVVRNIAWEVIPDLAEMVVKERIRQLESEA